MKIQWKLAMGAILTAIFSFVVTPNNANAEQPAAEQYRQMFKSGNFYIEYQMFAEMDVPVLGHYKFNSAKMVLAGQNGKRMMRETSTGGIFSHSTSRTTGGTFANNELETAYNSNYYKRIFKFHMSSKKNYPDVLYSDGKYYRFIDPADGNVGPFSFLSGGKKEVSAIVLPEDQLNSPNLDDSEEWNFVREDLTLPDELAIFYWEDPFRDNLFNMPAPHYNGEFKVTFENKEYSCDQYLIDIKSLAGNIIAQEAYNMLYDNGQLKVIQKYLIRDGKESLIRTTKISALTSEVPDTAFEIGRKIKVYAAQNGNMADLLEQKTLIETLGGK